MRQLANQAPGIRVSVTMIEPQKMAEQLERGQIDFAFTTPDDVPPTTRGKTLFHEDYVFVLDQFSIQSTSNPGASI